MIWDVMLRGMKAYSQDLRKRVVEAVDAGVPTRWVTAKEVYGGEFRKLLWRLVWAVEPAMEFVLEWSVWRRRDQAVAGACHYKRRLARLGQQLPL